MLAPTLGPLVCAFIERNLVHGPGDYVGQPFLLRPWEKGILYRLYELRPTGQRRWRHALLGLPKGNAKTELAAALSIVEAAGPVVFDGWRASARPQGKPRTSPDIPIAAASFDQADLVFGAARVMIREGPLRDLFDVYETEILLRGRAGRMFRVAAVAGTNEGGRPTFGARDELHEWTGTKERVHLVLQNNLAKRSGTWALDISTAGWDMTSLLGRLHTRGQQIANGEAPAGDFLMIWHQAAPQWDLAKDEEFEAACTEANPALGDFLALENLYARYRSMPEYEFRRYHLNQWVSAPSRWMPEGAWEGRADTTRSVADQAPVVLALDGEWDGTAVALVGCTSAKPRHLFLVDLWQRPEGAPLDWSPPKTDAIKAAVRNACAKWRVAQVAANPSRWSELFTDLAAEGLPMVEWPIHSTPRMSAACKQFYDAVVVDGELSHDGRPAFAQHFAAALVKEDGHGRAWIGRAPAATAAVVAYDAALRAPETTSVYESRGILDL